MHTFKDSADRLWTVAINVSAIKRVRGLINIDLYGLVDDRFEGLAKLLADPISLIDVIYCLCRDEAEKRGITDEAFGAAFHGDVIEHASRAFLEEFTDFFPDPRVRAGLAKVMQKSRTVADRLLERAQMEIDQIDPDREARKLIASFGSSQERSESTQDLTP